MTQETSPAAVAGFDADWRDRLLSDPDLILEDRDLMRALIAANDRQMGGNIVDMRGLAMERLESRLERLEDTHRSVIAAAYENLTGMNTVHRAALRVLEADSFESFLTITHAELPTLLRVDRARLVIESHDAGPDGGADMAEALLVMPAGFIDSYLTLGRDLPPRAVTLRPCPPAAGQVYGENAQWVGSEALMRLDLGPARLPALLALAAEDAHMFRPSQGTDLMGFFGGVYERVMRAWLGS